MFQNFLDFCFDPIDHLSSKNHFSSFSSQKKFVKLFLVKTYMLRFCPFRIYSNLFCPIIFLNIQKKRSLKKKNHKAYALILNCIVYLSNADMRASSMRAFMSAPTYPGVFNTTLSRSTSSFNCIFLHRICKILFF